MEEIEILTHDEMELLNQITTLQNSILTQTERLSE